MKKKQIDLDKLSDEDLLSMRMCDLGLKIEGTWLEGCIAQLYGELSKKGINYHPPCYLADEWLCPDGEPVIGVAFFLAHSRLRKLEYKMMLEVEGGDRSYCMKLLRHEMGHAINYAYLLHRKKKWRDIFGPFSAEYGESYKYRPYSKSFVRHLEEWYAQYHPDEDFAETFAVWLDPDSNWKEKYRGWKALKKLEYVDKMMEILEGKPPKKTKGDKYWEVSKLKSTLKTYYRRKRKLYAENYADFHDFQLKKIFSSDSGHSSQKKAYELIRQYRGEILNYVSLWTGEKKFIINGLLKDLVGRSRELGLEAGQDERAAVLNLAVYVTAQIMNYLYAGGYKGKK
ncbi:MAG: putative zinc-binding metallopeptidase [Candidatus Omnitrophota bacterium]|nr:putative zinc-binding metallopeptidase [Candidatus Omnitrophota bacterium]